LSAAGCIAPSTALGGKGGDSLLWEERMWGAELGARIGFPGAPMWTRVAPTAYVGEWIVSFWGRAVEAEARRWEGEF